MAPVKERLACCWLLTKRGRNLGPKVDALAERLCPEWSRASGTWSECSGREETGSCQQPAFGDLLLIPFIFILQNGGDTWWLGLIVP